MCSVFCYGQVIELKTDWKPDFPKNGEAVSYFTCYNTITKADIPFRYIVIISLNPPIGISKLMLESTAKEYNDPSITWVDMGPFITEHQILGGDQWVCADSWGMYPNGYWSGIGARDLFTMRDYMSNMWCIDLSRTVIQKDNEYEKFVFPAYALTNHPKMTEVKLPRRTIKIDKGAFKDCEKLLCVNGSCFYGDYTRSVRYYNNPLNAGDPWDMSVFGEVDLSGLHDENEIIDEAFVNFTEIGDSAFWNTGIFKVQLPKSFKKMGNHVFGQCNMKQVTMHSNTIPELGVEAFGEHEKDSVILYVPRESLKEYKKAFETRFKAIRPIGYVSPNPINTYFKESNLIIEIREDADDAGTVKTIDVKSGKEEITSLKAGVNAVPLSLEKKYEITVGDETFKLNRYEF